MNTPKMISAMMALMLSTLSIPAAQADVYAPQAPASAYVELNAVQLDQLVAPIALDPDSLVAQILTASTYPDQVSDADNWLNQNMNLPPDQRAAGANNMSLGPRGKRSYRISGCSRQPREKQRVGIAARECLLQPAR